ncbi:MAG: glycosyltransferase [Phycisphaeraceae bacterium]
MRHGMNIAFFGSSLVSAYWNGAATYYRGIVRALHERGHRVTFYEPDVLERQQHRDIDDPPWARVVVYSADGTAGVRKALHDARHADLVIKASGVGVFDELLEAEVLEMQSASRVAAFWDVDAPATLDRLAKHPNDPLRRWISQYDLVLTYGGGAPVVNAYTELGAQRVVPIYNAHDADTHFPVPAKQRFAADLGFLGNRLPDREARVDDYFFEAAQRCTEQSFSLGGSGWEGKMMPPNVRYVGHVYTRDHNAFNCSARVVLNINRESMASYGFSPATRVFEACGAGACVLTDTFKGVEQFFEPGEEVLLAENGRDVAQQLCELDPAVTARIGQAARERALAEHTYHHRAALLEEVLDAAPGQSRPRIAQHTA